jgi:hypothetical protein
MVLGLDIGERLHASLPTMILTADPSLASALGVPKAAS